MRGRRGCSLLSICLMVLCAAPAFGGGFVRYDGSPRGNVLGAALTASADDPSALYFNPAGITQLAGAQAMCGVSLIMPENTVEALGVRTDMEKNRYAIPFLYVTQQINANWYAGIGVFSRFGLGTEFTQSWPGRYNNYRTKMKEMEANPNIAWRINDRVSIAVGLSVMWLDLSMSRKLPPYGGVPETDFHLSGDSWGWGWNLSVQYKPTDWMQLGLAYRSRVDHTIKGTATSNPSSVLYPGTNAKGDITLPDMILFGVNTNLTKTLSIGGGVFWTGWQSYDKLEMAFEQPVGGRSVSSSQKNWKNVARYLIAMEWKATPNWDVRLGYAYDEAPQRENLLDYVLPENDRHMMSCGIGYHRGAWASDFSYTYMILKDRSVAAHPSEGIFGGRYTDGSSQLIALSFTRKF